MHSGGRTNQVTATEVAVGRTILCKEDPKTPATSTCAKQLTSTIDAAKKGLTAEQAKIWRALVFTPGVLLAQRFSEMNTRHCVRPWTFGRCTITKDQSYAINVEEILAGTLKFPGLFGGQFKWSDYLTTGAAIIKKLPVLSTGGCEPWDTDCLRRKGTAANPSTTPRPQPRSEPMKADLGGGEDDGRPQPPRPRGMSGGGWGDR